MRHLRGALLLAALVLITRDGPAQRSVTVRVDNDAFNFWQAPWNRPDEEFTSGVRLNVEYDGRAPWARGKSGGAGACGDGIEACATHAYTIGQDIYTATRSREQPTPLAGSRADAGVLWISSSNRRVRAARVTELSWIVGVTGEPALAAPVQRFFHDIAPGWNGPIDWANQLPAEAVIGVRYEQRRMRSVGVVELQPHAGASVGTLLTEVRVGIGARTGTDFRETRRARDDRRLRWSFVGDATLRGVARDAVLSGTLFRPSQRVVLRPAVTELQAGLTARWRRLGLSWIAHQTSAEYRTRHRSHAWSTLEASWWPGR